MPPFREGGAVLKFKWWESRQIVVMILSIIYSWCVILTFIFRTQASPLQAFFKLRQYVSIWITIKIEILMIKSRQIVVIILSIIYSWCVILTIFFRTQASPRQASFESRQYSFESQSGMPGGSNSSTTKRQATNSPPLSPTRMQFRKKFRRMSGCGSSSGEFWRVFFTTVSCEMYYSLHQVWQKNQIYENWLIFYRTLWRSEILHYLKKPNGLWFFWSLNFCFIFLKSWFLPIQCLVFWKVSFLCGQCSTKII